MQDNRVGANVLTVLAADLLRAQGLNAEHADQVANVLVWADLRGVESHGVSRLPLYLKWLRSGEMNTNAHITTALALPALAILEGDRCPGAVGMRLAVSKSMQLAQHCGLGMVMLRSTTHTGALGYYTAMLANAGMAGWAMAASGPNMGYQGTAVPAVSTAPLSIAVPYAGHPPVVFDMAASVIPVGRLAHARASGSALPPDAAMDHAGRATQDAQQAVAPLPLGGPKGSGLALMSEMLCSLLPGESILTPALQNRQSVQPHRQNALVVAVDIVQLRTENGFAEDVGALAAALKSLPAVAEGEILLPGERGWREHDRRSSDGIPLSAAVRKSLTTVARELGLATPWQ